MKKALALLASFAVWSAVSNPRLESAEPAASTSVGTEAQGKVDINTAAIPVLEAIPEIGTNFANAVVAARPFKSVDELQPILKISAEGMVALHARVTAVPPKIPSSLAHKPSDRSSSLASTTETSLPPAVASEQERAEAKRRHVRKDGRLAMAKPPPPARDESKSAQPGSNYVWKPGHWSPVRGEWEWTAGEWAVPPTPVSVWIEGTYDAKDQRWSPGYWEPDTLRTPEE